MLTAFWPLGYQDFDAPAQESTSVFWTPAEMAFDPTAVPAGAPMVLQPIIYLLVR